jgi:predicted  nucleic acid-binding Zn-ribbon protein
MTRMILAALLLPCLAAVGTAEQTKGVSGVQKVIQMLTDMSGKAKKEKADEEIAFAKFESWCKNGDVNLKAEIKQNAEDIESLTTEIGSLASDITGLGDSIATLQKDEEEYNAQLKRANEKREKDHASFLEEEQDYSESVDAISRALNVLSRDTADRPGAASLLQVDAMQRLPEKARDIVQALVSMLEVKAGAEDEGDDYAAPEANAYENQSGGLIEMLKKLQDEFREKLGECQKAEMNSKAAYDMVVADLTASISNAGKDIKESTATKDRKIAKKASNKKELGATVEVKAENEKTLKNMDAECSEKSMSFEEKQKLRAEEIEAIEKATEIMQSPDVTGNAEKHLSLAQTQATSLVQLRGQTAAPLRRQVRDFLATEGRRLKSKGLALLSQKIAADPFAKVKSMIDSMITRLMEEANADAEHEGFCDKEMGESKVTRNKLTEDIDALNAAIEDGKSTILSLAENTQELEAELESTQKSMGEAMALRTEEKAKNKAVIEDAQAASAATQAATAVLKDFYEKAAMATGFLQVKSETHDPRIKMGTDEWKALANPAYDIGADGNIGVDQGHKEGMQTFGEKFTGQQDEAKFGVLAMLEVILSDFSNLEAETAAAETESESTFKSFMTESKKSKVVKERKVEMNTADKAAAELKMQEDIKDLKATQDELLAADRYYEKLVPQCVDQGQTWDERVAARQAEIDSLKEALKILGNQGSVETSN